MWSAAETPAQPQPGAEGLVISRTAPCLLPELQHVRDIPAASPHDILSLHCPLKTLLLSVLPSHWLGISLRSSRRGALHLCSVLLCHLRCS